VLDVVRALGRHWRVRVEKGTATVEPSAEARVLSVRHWFETNES
jgi:hypothetical protein